MDNKEKFSITCGWGECIDVLLTNKGMPYMLYDNPSELDKFTHGISKEGSIELSRHEARNLANRLLMAANQCDAFDESYEDYLKQHENDEGENNA